MPILARLNEKLFEQLAILKEELAQAKAKIAAFTEGRKPVFPWELGKEGGTWLGAARGWIQRSRSMGNGESIGWGSATEIKPPLTMRDVEDIACEVAAAAINNRPSEDILRSRLMKQWEAEVELTKALGQVNFWKEQGKMAGEEVEALAAVLKASKDDQKNANLVECVKGIIKERNELRSAILKSIKNTDDAISLLKRKAPSFKKRAKSIDVKPAGCTYSFQDGMCGLPMVVGEPYNLCKKHFNETSD